MRWYHTGPIDWPSQAEWDARAASDEELPPIDASGRVLPDDDDMPPDLWIGLVKGEHGQPGARYEVREPTLTRGHVSARIDGSRMNRTVAIEYREPTGVAASVTMDGIDAVRSLHAVSDLPHLRLEVRASTAPPAVLRGRVRLDWLKADVSVQVRGGRARVRGSVRGIGLWRLLLAPAWVVLRLRTDVGHAVYQQVVDVAAGSGGVGFDGDRATRQAQVTEARIRRWLRLRDQLEGAVTAVDDKPRFRRARTAWADATAPIRPQVQLWLDPDTPDDIYIHIDGAAIDAIVDEVGAVPRIDRRLRAHALVDERIAEERRAPKPAVDRAAGADVPVDADAWADLRWLHSPVTIVRHVLQQVRGPDAPPVSLWRPSTWAPSTWA